MDFGLDPPYIHIEEEELVDARTILPPSFFSDSPPKTNLHFPFQEPPAHSRLPIPGPQSSPFPPSRVRSLPPLVPASGKPNLESTVPTPILPSTSLSRSVSSDTTSTQCESSATDDDTITSPVAIIRGLDRLRFHRNTNDIRKYASNANSGPTRIPGVASSEASSTAASSPEMVCSPGTLRRINALSSDQFRIAIRGFGSRRAASARGDLACMRNGKQGPRTGTEDSRAEKRMTVNEKSAARPLSMQRRTGVE